MQWNFTAEERRGEGVWEIEGDEEERGEGRERSVQGTEREGRSYAGDRLKREGSNGLER